MSKPCLLAGLVLFALSSFGQQRPEGKTYALVVGIANYENRNIPNLNFSNRDAEIFAQYLQSPAGGSVPARQIRLLVDTAATTAAVYNSLEWLKNKCQEDHEESPGIVNTVYFYFSGHGDLESQTARQLGYLLCYNTPANNYINNAIRIEDLNIYASTLSVRLGARVILITDACHSGRLAGSDNRGSFLVGRELATARAREIRIASCLPEELAQEDVTWGGGRGVFSWYLLNGLQGMADRDSDSSVTLGEIKTFLQASLANDAHLQQNKKVQTPVLKGPETMPLARVSAGAFDSVKMMLTPAPVELSDRDYFFSLPRDRNLFESVNFRLLKTLAKEEIPIRFIQLIRELKDSAAEREALEKIRSNTSSEDLRVSLGKLRDSRSVRQRLQEIRKGLDDFQKNPRGESMVYGLYPTALNIFLGDLDLRRETYGPRLRRYEDLLGSDRDEMQSFTELLVELLHSSGQKIINLYLQGDLAELERRAYYNSSTADYGVYADMYETVLKLIPPELPLARISRLNLNYFSGLVARLMLPRTEPARQATLVQEAFLFQQKALALEPEAAYVHNELGILYWTKKDFNRAREHFKKATELAPEWAIPWANLAGMAGETRDFTGGIRAAEIADSLQAGLHTTALQRGYLYQQAGNLLFAEEFYRKSIDINSRHFFPFEGLANTYLKTARYAQADSFFFEAEIRKKGYHFSSREFTAFAVLAPRQILTAAPCLIDPSLIRNDDVVGLFCLAMQEYARREGGMREAQQTLKKILAADSTNPLAAHYLGTLYYRERNWEAAEIMFRMARSYYRDDESFERYVDSVNARARFSYDSASRACFLAFFRRHHYAAHEDDYFLASAYENWQHLEDAERVYRRLIERNPREQGAYVKLWRQMEMQGRFAEAEELIRRYEDTFYGAWPTEMMAFYQRMMERSPENGDWPYKLGLYLYEDAFDASHPYLDTVLFFPVLNKELFLGPEEYSRLTTDPQLRLDRHGSPELNAPPNLQQLSEGIPEIELPGTEEKLVMAKGPVHALRKTAIYYFELADGLVMDPQQRADINFKIGNLYLRAGSTKMATPHFERVRALDPSHITARMKLAEVYRSNYRNREALAELNFLYDSSRIDFSQRLALAEFLVHEGKFEKATRLLVEAQAIYPYPLDVPHNLVGRIHMLRKNYAAAIASYRRYLEHHPSDPATSYNIARLYQLSGNNKQAMIWLRRALEAGFNYSYVLQNDEAWKGLRQSRTWNSLLEKFTMKTYRDPAGL